MGNGDILKGFVLKIDEKFLLLVENDNSEVLVNKDNISYAKIIGPNLPKERTNVPNVIVPKDFVSYPANNNAETFNDNEFSMELPKINNLPQSIRKPEFVKSRK
jgi:hypothetical protein